jgi:SHS family lactate transporter-like MFS transporter
VISLKNSSIPASGKAWHDFSRSHIYFQEDKMIKDFLLQRIQTLKPAFDKAPDPITLFRKLSGQQWRFFLIGFFAWAWDAFDFYTVPLTYASLANTFLKSTADISWGVTLALMFRPLGAAIFGVTADRIGRKWPLIINCALLVILEGATGFCETFEQFLAVRALFGVTMGGIYGNAATTALEDCPKEAQGLMSGIFQSAYPFGFLLATLFWKAFDGHTSYAWRPLFWFGAGFPVILIICRWLMPETEKYSQRKAVQSGNHLRDIVQDAKLALVKNWALMIYLVVFMVAFSYMVSFLLLKKKVYIDADILQSHGTQDLYPTMLKVQYHYHIKEATNINVVSCLGGMLGGICAGYASQIYGRRFCIILLCLLGSALLYPYTSIRGNGLYASGFFEWFCVQGMFGIIPIHLIELSPPVYSTLIVGASYNLGVLGASASNTIQTNAALHYPLGDNAYDYGIVICIFTAVVFTLVIILTFLGPENRRPDTMSDGNEGEDEEAEHDSLDEDKSYDPWKLGTVHKGNY